MCFASTFTDSHKKKLESGWVVPMRQGPPWAVSPTQSQLSRRGKIILLSDKDWLSNSALAHTICILPSLMLLSLVNKMLEHCRAAGDEMLREYDDSRYLTNWPTNLQAMVNLFVFFVFVLFLFLPWDRDGAPGYSAGNQGRGAIVWTTGRPSSITWEGRGNKFRTLNQSPLLLGEAVNSTNTLSSSVVTLTAFITSSEKSTPLAFLILSALQSQCRY